MLWGDIPYPHLSIQGNSRGCGGSRWKLTKTKSPGPPKRTKSTQLEATNFFPDGNQLLKNTTWVGQHGLGKCVLEGIGCAMFFFPFFLGMMFWFSFGFCWFLFCFVWFGLFWHVLFVCLFVCSFVRLFVCLICLFVWLVCLITVICLLVLFCFVVSFLILLFRFALLVAKKHSSDDIV